MPSTSAGKMRDLEKAKRILKERNQSLVIVKEGRIIFCLDSSGIDGILQAIEKKREDLCGASIADKVVGKAAALLFAYSHVARVYASILSRRGLKTLREHKIPVEYDLVVPEIMNKERTDTCPFEKFVSEIESPSHAFEELKAYVENLKMK